LAAYGADAQAEIVVYALGGALWVVRTGEGAPVPVA
jgi:hypothetical protein